MNEHKAYLNLEEALDSWPAEQAELKKVFLELKSHAEGLPDALPSFVSRPGISHSLRFDISTRPKDRKRPVFLLVDVISDAGQYFLSVCFYQDEITDPQELGNAIPAGLFKETGYCFDVEDDDPELTAYLKKRIIQAHSSAAAA